MGAGRVRSDPAVLRPATEPFQPDGGLRVLGGSLGHAVIKRLRWPPEHRVVEAPARVFTTRSASSQAFSRRELDCDVVVVIREQGPAANGMPELHALTPSLQVLQKRGYAVALVTDGRMSGASGAIPAAIHVTPESVHAGPIPKVQDGDVVRVDTYRARSTCLSTPSSSPLASPSPRREPRRSIGTGRELFATLRAAVGRADEGAHVFASLAHAAVEPDAYDHEHLPVDARHRRGSDVSPMTDNYADR